ncbi:MAG: PQQ-dependent sugar dehydrogenase [Hyphomicrobium aestuarii]|nr:PQQ-dependent sugar dehydrogenase [Hyphomicrobium aestuarii]
MASINKLKLGILAMVIGLNPAKAFAAPAATVIDGKYQIETLATLDHPWSIAALPDGRLLLTEKPGRLRMFADGKLSEPISGMPAVAYREQGGLLAVAVDPAFAENKYIYLSFAQAAEQQPTDAKETIDKRLGENQKVDDVTLKGLAVARARLDDGKLNDLTVIWQQVPKTIGRGYFGGQLAFAKDGTLMITSGDRQQFEPAQDLMSNIGKIVRINSDGSLPSGNAFPDRQDARGDIWSFGHRNPLGILLDRATDTLWSHEMGPKGGDEVNLIKQGANYGWPKTSEGVHYNDAAIPKHATDRDINRPALAWVPAISPAGFAMYTGDAFPAWRGKALIGGLSAKALVVVSLDAANNKAVEVERITMDRRIRDVMVADDGTLYLIGDAPDGALLKMTPVKAERGASN